MPVYSYFLFGGPKTPPLQFDLDSDASAIGLSICVLRDHPAVAQVWIIEGREPVAVRLRSPERAVGALIDLREAPGEERLCIEPAAPVARRTGTLDS